MYHRPLPLLLLTAHHPELDLYAPPLPTPRQLSFLVRDSLTGILLSSPPTPVDQESCIFQHLLYRRCGISARCYTGLLADLGPTQAN
jgi:hypothetical protein